MGDVPNTYNEFVAKLSFYEVDYLQYTECLIRQREILLTNKPEEVVRQTLLYFLINYLPEIYHSLVDIVVEHHNVDIALLKKYIIPEFRPTRSPILLIEVKRNESALRDYQSQLISYMEELRCDRGILFNFSEILLFEKQSEAIAFSSKIPDLISIKNYIIGIEHDEDEDLINFLKANDGSFEHFKKLAVKYKYSRASFICKEFTAPVEGFIFEFSGDMVLFDVVGHYAKKKRNFNSSNFVKLISFLD